MDTHIGAKAPERRAYIASVTGALLIAEEWGFTLEEKAALFGIKPGAVADIHALRQKISALQRVGEARMGERLKLITDIKDGIGRIFDENVTLEKPWLNVVQKKLGTKSVKSLLVSGEVEKLEQIKNFLGLGESKP